MTEDIVKKSIPHRSWQSVRIQQALEALDVGATITYQELGAVIDQHDVRYKDAQRAGVNVRIDTRYILATAVNRALRDSGVVVVCLHGEGYKRVGGGEKLDPVGHLIKHASMKAGHASRILRTLDAGEWAQMTPVERTTALARKLQASEIAIAGKPSTLRNAQELGADNNPELPAWAATTGGAK